MFRQPEVEKEREQVVTQAIYTMAVVTFLCGLPPYKVRSLEKDGLVKPERTAAGHRLFSDRDLGRLRLISKLLRNGMQAKSIVAAVKSGLIPELAPLHKP